MKCDECGKSDWIVEHMHKQVFEYVCTWCGLCHEFKWTSVVEE